MMKNHPLNERYAIPPTTSLLIVGTAPPPRFSSSATANNRKRLDFEFFYGSEDSDMWPILEEIAEERERRKLFQDEDSSEKCCVSARGFLERHGLWMRDVLDRFERKPDKATSAIDPDIVKPKPDDFTRFRPIFASCPSLKMIAFTSQDAARWTFKALDHQGLIPAFSFSNALTTWRKCSNVGSKYATPLLTNMIAENLVNFFLLPSPSPRSPESYEIKKRAYRTVLFEIPKQQ